MSANTLQKALMRPGDFHLRGDARQMFGNYVVLSAGGGTPGLLENYRRSASFVATPVYSEPKVWRLRVDFETILSSPQEPLSPWVPISLATGIVRVTVRQALDRDKAAISQVFDLSPRESGVNIQCAMPAEIFVGHQIGVTVEIISSSLTPIGCQVSLVEVTDEGRDAYPNSRILRFAQSATTAIFLQPNPRRRQFFVQNFSDSPLYVAFDFFAVVPGATARFTMALPQRGDIYESLRDCWQGFVAGVWDVDSATDTDFAIVTEGT